MNAQTHPWPTAHSVEDFRRNLAAVHRRIADACSRAGRDPS
ncbi:MAG: YggS family pyridoxal phosphate-dependent enzyme, partial [Gammaproteobacteria bacterium]